MIYEFDDVFLVRRMGCQDFNDVCLVDFFDVFMVVIYDIMGLLDDFELMDGIIDDFVLNFSSLFFSGENLFLLRYEEFFDYVIKL